MREPDLNVASPEFLRWVHGRFYNWLPERLRWVSGDHGERAYVEAGLFRTRFVKVGVHIPPGHEALDSFLERFMTRRSSMMCARSSHSPRRTTG